MTEQMEGQMSIFDLDIWSGKTSQEHLVPTKERTLDASSKKQRKSQTVTPLFLDLRKTETESRNGLRQGQYWEMGGLLLGEYMMHSFGESPKDENAYVYWLISTETPQEEYCLNCSEKPLKVIPSKLSWILEQNPDPKYNLSAKACQGILRRAEKRGKKLPKILKDALERQAQ